MNAIRTNGSAVLLLLSSQQAPSGRQLTKTAKHLLVAIAGGLLAAATTLLVMVLGMPLAGRLADVFELEHRTLSALIYLVLFAAPCVMGVSTALGIFTNLARGTNQSRVILRWELLAFAAYGIATGFIATLRSC